MSLFHRSLRPPGSSSEAAVERYLRAIYASIEPDPQFRLRLRGATMNRFVAGREGHRSSVVPMRREMGRIGRAVLYASFTLALSVTSVMAASQSAIPGDVLYPLKRQIEQIRYRAVPAHLHALLAASELSERLVEMGRLAELGRWEHMIAVAGEVRADYPELLAMDRGASAGLESRLVVVAGLLEHLPEDARTAIEDRWEGMPGIDPSGGSRGLAAPSGSGGGEDTPGTASESPAGNFGGANNDGGNPNGTSNQGGASNDGTSGNAPPQTTGGGSGQQEPPRASPTMSQQPAPTASPGPTKSPKPTKSPSPAPSS
jgi:hypothetical protein